MSGQHIRKDKTCRNCTHVVELAYCPKCGQKNTETRQSFGHLFTHFIEDFTHYDNAFWKTMQNLLFRPGKLTILYLDGKRQKFVPPVKLYIFVSFLTFFILAMIPSEIDDVTDMPGVKTEYTVADSTQVKVDEGVSILGSVKYKSASHYDSIQQTLPAIDKDDKFRRYMIRNLVELQDVKSRQEVILHFKNAALNNLPKALFLYLPIFAFWLWLLHSKKRWMFFDHGIFTLHYFAFMLLLFSMSILLDEALAFLPDGIYETLSFINGFATILWIFIYFFIAHKRIYREDSVVSHMKSLLLFFINSLLMGTLLIVISLLLLFSIT